MIRISTQLTSEELEEQYSVFHKVVSQNYPSMNPIGKERYLSSTQVMFTDFAWRYLGINPQPVNPYIRVWQHFESVQEELAKEETGFNFEKFYSTVTLPSIEMVKSIKGMLDISRNYGDMDVPTQEDLEQKPVDFKLATEYILSSIMSTGQNVPFPFKLLFALGRFKSDEFYTPSTVLDFLVMKGYIEMVDIPCGEVDEFVRITSTGMLAAEKLSRGEEIEL